jgi:hypothetical protein
VTFKTGSCWAGKAPPRSAGLFLPISRKKELASLSRSATRDQRSALGSGGLRSADVSRTADTTADALVSTYNPSRYKGSEPLLFEVQNCIHSLSIHKKKQGRGRRKREREKLSAVMHLPSLPPLSLTSELLTPSVRTLSAVNRSPSRRMTLQAPSLPPASPPMESCTRATSHPARPFLIDAAMPAAARSPSARPDS